MMEQLRQIGEVLGSLKVLMVFKDDIRINRHQCSLLYEIFKLGLQGIAEEIRDNLKFDERLKKWKALEQPLKELFRTVKEGESYIKHCLEPKDSLGKAISLPQNNDCVEFHLHNFIWCVFVVFESIEIAGEIAGYDQEETQKKKLLFSKRYEREWLDKSLFQWNFGKKYLVSREICNRLNTVWKEDRKMFLEILEEKRRTKSESRILDLLHKNFEGSEVSKGDLFPCSILTDPKDYQVRRRLGNGGQHKEIHWMGESFAVRHFHAEVEPLIPEISLLSSLMHPNIMHILCGFVDKERKECFLVMELMNRDLSNYIKETCGPRKRVPFTLPVTVDVMLQIARGMEYLHSRKIYHGNLNPSNILVRVRNPSSEGHLHVKITGFGLTSVKNSTSKNSANQPTTDPVIWYAPEVLQEQEQGNPTSPSKYTEKADVYSFSMICFELLTGKLPFEEGHLQGDKMSRNLRAGERPLFPFPSPKYLTALTKKCWQDDPNQRPNFSSICRTLRYIKRFLVMNQDHDQPDAPLPLIDYMDLEANFSKRLLGCGEEFTESVSLIPFQMFAYRVIERQKTMVNLKEKNSESGSDGASVGGDENQGNVEETFSNLKPTSRSSQSSSESTKKPAFAKKTTNGKSRKSSGHHLSLWTFFFFGVIVTSFLNWLSLGKSLYENLMWNNPREISALGFLLA
ncbi:hypothetical protein AMTRI_Chr01g107680 [Amborella trichopoda]